MTSARNFIHWQFANSACSTFPLQGPTCSRLDHALIALNSRNITSTKEMSCSSFFEKEPQSSFQNSTRPRLVRAHKIPMNIPKTIKGHLKASLSELPRDQRPSKLSKNLFFQIFPLCPLLQTHSDVSLFTRCNNKQKHNKQHTFLTELRMYTFL